MTILSILLVIAISVILWLWVDRSATQSDLRLVLESRNDWRQRFAEAEASATRLYQQRDESRRALDVIATKQRAAGIALGFVEPIEEVDDITF